MALHVQDQRQDDREDDALLDTDDHDDGRGRCGHPELVLAHPPDLAHVRNVHFKYVVVCFRCLEYVGWYLLLCYCSCVHGVLLITLASVATQVKCLFARFHGHAMDAVDVGIRGSRMS